MWYWLGGLLGVALSPSTVLRWVASHGLSYYVGTDVTLGAATLRWEEGWQWRLSLSQVQLSSTSPAIPFMPLAARNVELTFVGRQLQAVTLEGVRAFLVRTDPSMKNYRKLFPRRGRGRPLTLTVKATEVVFYLVNSPSDVEVQTFVPTVRGQLRVDSNTLGIVNMEAELHRLELCYAGRSLGRRGPLAFRYAGWYDKGADSWRQAFLQLRDSLESLQYEGAILRWAKLIGTAQIAFRATWLPASWRSGVGERISLTVAIDTARMVATGWGQGEWGRYQVCGICSGGACPLKGWHGLELSLQAPGRYQIQAFSDDGYRWQARGQGLYKGYPWAGNASIDDITQQTGRLSVQVEGLRLWYAGGLSQGTGRVKMPAWWVAFAWNTGRGLTIQADSLALGAVRTFLTRYKALLQGNRGLAWQAQVRRLLIDSTWLAEDLQAKSLPGGIGVEGRLRHMRWDTSAIGWGYLTLDGSSGRFGMREGDHRWGLWGSWQGDFVGVVATGLFMGRYLGAVTGYWKAGRLWVHQLCLHTPVGGHLSYQGSLSLDSVDGQVAGAVALNEVLDLCPVPGVALLSGELSGALCASEQWSDLLSLDNHTEGKLQLSAVRGRFLKPDLPFILAADVSYDQAGMALKHLEAHIGEFRLRGHAVVEGTLGYLYEDWRRLRGSADIQVWDFALSSIWRVREGGRYRRQVLLPSEMELRAQIHGYGIDLLGYRFDTLQLDGYLADQLVAIEQAEGIYQLAHIRGRGLLDASDTSCYLAGFEVALSDLQLAPFLAMSGLLRFPTIAKLRLSGRFSGHLQAALRFGPGLTWRQNSTLMAKGQIYGGQLKPPPFLRWFRPFYIASYRDSLDFIADVPKLILKDGHLTIPEALIFTRLGAVRVDGTHLLAQERFFYRLQGARLYRKAQRHASLTDLLPYVKDRLRMALWIVYVEKDGRRTRWIYPYRYVLRQLF